MRNTLVSLFLFLCACSTPPVEEFTLYKAAFDKAHTATGQVLDTYSGIEKASELTEEDTRVFNPDKAFLFSDNADGPITRDIRRGFEAIKAYNAVLARYADGSSVSVFDKDVSNLSAAITRLGAATGSVAFGVSINAILAATQKLLGAALSESDTAEFNAAVSQGAEAVRGFLDLVRSDTARIFEEARGNMTKAVVAKKITAQARTDKLATFKTLLANWVILINETQVALNTLEYAAQHGGASGLSLQSLARSTDRLAKVAEDIDDAFNELSKAF